MKSLIILTVGFLGLVIIQACKHDPFPAPPPGMNDTITNPGDTNGPGDSTNFKPCDPDTVYFNRDVQPILSGSCAIPQCHDAQSAKDGVVLDSYQNTVNTGDIEPFDLDAGKLYELVSYTDYDPGDPYSVMPPLPNTRLTTEEVALIRKWILQGAQNLNCDDCDTVGISFLTDVLPVFSTSCQKNCHNPTDMAGGISLTTYSEIAQEVKYGEVLLRINHNPQYSPMPPGGTKLDQCSLDKISAWINAGYPNN